MTTWAKLSTEFYTDPIIRAAANLEPMTLAVWPVLIAKSKHESSAENVSGEFKIVLNDLAAQTCTSVDQLERILQNLESGGLIFVEQYHLGIIAIKLEHFEKWQTPRGTKKERDERYREHASREKAKKNVVRTSRERRDDVAVTSHERQSDDLEREREREREREKRENNPHPSRVRAHEAADADDDDDFLSIFSFFLEKTNRDESECAFTDFHRGLLADRLGEGYSVDQLKQAVAGIADSEWHRGGNPSKKRFDTFEFIFRNAENVEKGIGWVTSNVFSGVDDQPKRVICIPSSGEVIDVNKRIADWQRQGHNEATIEKQIDRWRKMGGIEYDEESAIS